MFVSDSDRGEWILFRGGVSTPLARAEICKYEDLENRPLLHRAGLDQEARAARAHDPA